eukprot:SAG31_NODE_2517_length_5576_cov_3.265839_7_plen_294_part_00
MVATFESGATIEYHGTVTAALTFQGLCTVTYVPPSAVGFKSVGTTGTLGGSVMIVFKTGTEGNNRGSDNDDVANIGDSDLQRVYYTVPDYAAGWSAEAQQAIQESKVEERKEIMDLFNKKKQELLTTIGEDVVEGDDEANEQDDEDRDDPLPSELGFLVDELAAEQMTSEHIATEEAAVAEELAAALQAAEAEGEGEDAKTKAREQHQAKLAKLAELRQKRAAALAELAASSAAAENAWQAKLEACETAEERAALEAAHAAEIEAGTHTESEHECTTYCASALEILPLTAISA